MPQLTPGELKVMKLLWEHGELMSEFQDRFPRCRSRTPRCGRI